MTDPRQTIVSQIITQVRKITENKTASLVLMMFMLALAATTLNLRPAAAGAPADTDATSAAMVDGTGAVTITPVGTSCIAFTPPSGNGPANWEVAQGSQYTMTITGVTECTGDAITVFIQNSQTGNFCLQATGGNGTYVVNFTMANPTCYTSPISYKCGANQPCDNANTFNAQAPGARTVHLRANTFSNNCQTRVVDEDCVTVTPPPAPICPPLLIDCPADVSVSNDQGTCGAVVNYNIPTATGGCVPVTVVCEPNTGSTFPIGTTLVTCTATDSNDPSPTRVACSFNVTVTDNEKPTINCPTVEPACNTAGQCGTTVNYSAPTVSDNCAGFGAPTCSPASGSFFSPGVTEVICKVKDAVGNEAVCAFSVTVNDCEDPQLIITPPPVACNTPGRCDAAVSFTVIASDNCPGVAYRCTHEPGSIFPVGTTQVSCTARDAAGHSVTSTFSVIVDDCTRGSVSGKKFYDANANGQDDEMKVVTGWKITLSGPVNLTQFTNGTGEYSFNNLPAGTYTVSEVMAGSSWVATTPTSYGFTVGCGIPEKDYARNFGNHCKIPSGGKTIGFWGNKNGQALINAADLQALRDLNLVNANGSPFDPTSAAQLNTWLQGATAVNMSYMLSAQLAAMTLNLRKNFVPSNAFDLCSGKTVGALADTANAALGADGNTPSGDPNRSPQEQLKNCIDALNNNGLVVSATPCTFSTPY